MSSASRAKALAELSARIFGQVAHPPNVRSPTKYLRKRLKGAAVQAYYPPGMQEQIRLRARLWHHGFLEDDHLDWKSTKKAMNMKRGRDTTKKGAGARSKKKKK